jgi:hypothetical protein
MEEWLDRRTEDEVEYLDLIEGVEADLELLSTSTEIEEDLRQVLLYFTTYRLRQSFDSGDSSDLYEFATQCPWLGAKSLGMAQFLYSTVSDSSISGNDLAMS